MTDLTAQVFIAFSWGAAFGASLVTFFLSMAVLGFYLAARRKQ